jgi:hypothetical protein
VVGPPRARAKIAGVKLVTDVVAELSPNSAEVDAARRHVVAVAPVRLDVIILDTIQLVGSRGESELFESPSTAPDR